MYFVTNWSPTDAPSVIGDDWTVIPSPQGASLWNKRICYWIIWMKISYRVILPYTLLTIKVVWLIKKKATQWLCTEFFHRLYFWCQTTAVKMLRPGGDKWRHVVLSRHYLKQNQCEIVVKHSIVNTSRWHFHKHVNYSSYNISFKSLYSSHYD